MKQLIITIAALLLLPLAVMAQYEEDTENGVVSLNGKEGFTIATKKGDFVFKPYMLVQTSANINYYDDEGLDPAYNQDNIHNSGFSIPYAILGFTGKAFDRVTFNLSINAAGNGGNILQQAWFDVEIKKSFAIRVGKFKTPFSHAYLTTLGETLMPTLPTSLTSSVILPYSLNAVTPNIGMGFDLGVEVHGLVKEKFGYEVGIFNGKLRQRGIQNVQRRLAYPVIVVCRPHHLHAERSYAVQPGQPEPFEGRQDVVRSFHVIECGERKRKYERFPGRSRIRHVEESPVSRR